MNILVVSKSPITRGGIIKIVEAETFVTNIKQSYSYYDLHYEDIDLIISDTNDSSFKYLSYLKELKEKENLKIMILDFKEEEDVFKMCVDYNFDAYLLPNIDCENISWTLKQIQKGRKYYDSEFLGNSKQKESILTKSNLTDREKEVANLITEGYSNQDISKALYISINTVKKHISNILSKLDLKDRNQLTIYVFNKGKL